MPKYKIDLNSLEGFIIVLQASRMQVEGAVLNNLIMRNVPWYKRPLVRLWTARKIRKIVKAQMQQLDSGEAKVQLSGPGIPTQPEQREVDPATAN